MSALPDYASIRFFKFIFENTSLVTLDLNKKFSEYKLDFIKYIT